MRGRVLGCILAALAASCAIGATTAQAAITSSNITQPASGHIAFNAWTATLTVSGTAAGSGTVDIYCYTGSHPAYDWQLLQPNVTVTSNNTFSATLGTYYRPTGPCTLRAVPYNTHPTDLTMFTGPQVIADHREPLALTSGPNSFALYDYYFNDQQSPGYNDFDSVSSCGLCDSRLFIDPTNFYSSAYLFQDDAALLDHERLASNDRGYAQIDGHNVLFSASAASYAANASGFPVLTMSSSFAPNGDMTISEDEDAVRCPTDVLPYGPAPGENNCPNLLPTGVHLHRTIFQTAGGTVVQIVDTWSSPDNAAHDVNFDYDQIFNSSGGGMNNPPASVPSFEFPWIAPSFATHNFGDAIPAPSSQPVSMFVKGNSNAADGDTYYPQGAITVSPAPSGIKFYNANNPAAEFVLNFQRHIAAGGSLTIMQTFSIGTTQAGVAALAARAEDQQDVPVVAIGAPANGSTVSTPTVTLTGTATDRVISSLTVNGHAVAAGAGGAFSTPVNLSVGANTITATATDGAGNQGSASVKVSYQPPPPKLMLVGSPTPSSTGVAFSIDCQAAAGMVCAGGADMTTLEKLLGKKITGLMARKPKRGSKRVVVGSMTFSLAAGKTQKLVVPLNSTGRKLLARFKRLPVTLTIIINTNPASVLTTKTTIKPKKKKKKKH